MRSVDLVHPLLIISGGSYQNVKDIWQNKLCYTEIAHYQENKSRNISTGYNAATSTSPDCNANYSDITNKPKSK